MFESMHLGVSYVPDPTLRYAYEYHIRTEAFDRLCCQDPSRPTGREFSIVTRYAKQIIAGLALALLDDEDIELCHEDVRGFFNPEQSIRVISRKLPVSELDRILDVLNTKSVTEAIWHFTQREPIL